MRRIKCPLVARSGSGERMRKKRILSIRGRHVRGP